jgi:tRNA A-37 threonylcarbamoyl transferase component Bud32
MEADAMTEEPRMSEARSCSVCGAALPSDAPAGLCPKCLLERGLHNSGSSASTSAYPPAPFATPTPAELAGRFPQLEILELLGQGGMGAVYKARQRGLDRLVALKILPPEAGRDPAFAERFTREARALAKLSHANIVGVHDFGQADGLFYFVMEYVDGVNLRQALQGGQLQPAEALRIVPQICAALQFAHEEGVVHRDIKPENILLDKKGRVKIADFGLAKLLGRPTSDRLTATHQVMGTPHYMAPEQIERPQQVDHRADIYSLGVVFYEMLTGELPLGRFEPPSKRVRVDVRLDDVVLRALEREPERRYQTISHVKTEVEGIVAAPQSQMTFGLSGPSCIRSHKLLDATDSTRRLCQHAALTGAWFLVLCGMVISLTYMPSVGILVMVPSIPLIIVAAVIKQCWEVTYKGHRIRFENGVLSGSKLFLDDGLVRRGSIGFRIEMRARVKAGEGVGDEIVVWTSAGLLSFRCRISVEEAEGIPSGAAVPAEAQALRPDSPQRQPPWSRDEPRLSRWALGGACLALICALSVVAALVIIFVLPLGQFTASQMYGGSWFGQMSMNFDCLPRTARIIVVLLWLSAPASAIGTTICGAIAVARIKGSQRKLYGLQLAVADLVCYPLLLLGAVVFIFTMYAAHAWRIVTQGEARQPLPVSEIDGAVVSSTPTLAGWMLLAVPALAICYFAVRRTWRAVAPVNVEQKTPAAEAGPEKPPKQDNSATAAATAYWETWWFNRSALTQKALKILMIPVLLAALTLFLSFASTRTMEPGGTRTVYAIGVPTPWFKHEEWPMGFHTSIDVLSWSFLSGAVAAWTVYAAFRINRWEKRRKINADAQRRISASAR